MTRARLFRLRMRPGRALIGFGSAEARQQSAAAGDEVVVTEEVAASLVRNRAAEILEAVDRPSDGDVTDSTTST